MCTSVVGCFLVALTVLVLGEFCVCVSILLLVQLKDIFMLNLPVLLTPEVSVFISYTTTPSGGAWICIERTSSRSSIVLLYGVRKIFEVRVRMICAHWVYGSGYFSHQATSSWACNPAVRLHANKWQFILHSLIAMKRAFRLQKRAVSLSVLGLLGNSFINVFQLRKNIATHSISYWHHHHHTKTYWLILWRWLFAENLGFDIVRKCNIGCRRGARWGGDGANMKYSQIHE